MKTTRSKNPQWGPTAIKTLHPGFGAEVEPEVLEQGLDRYAYEAAQQGWVTVYRVPGRVTLARTHAATSAVPGAAVGFLFFGVVGAALGASASHSGARRETIEMWADAHGGIHVRTL